MRVWLNTRVVGRPNMYWYSHNIDGDNWIWFGNVKQGAIRRNYEGELRHQICVGTSPGLYNYRYQLPFSLTNYPLFIIIIAKRVGLNLHVLFFFPLLCIITIFMILISFSLGQNFNKSRSSFMLRELRQSEKKV